MKLSSLRLAAFASCAMGVVLYLVAFGGELVLWTTRPRPLEEQRALVFRERRIPNDKRSQLEVVRDLRASGVDAVPFFNVKDFLAAGSWLRLGRLPLMSLSGAALRQTVNCNEDGRWSFFLADRHGFNNPDAAWNADAEVVLLGDSFTMGQCVPEGRDIASLIRGGGLRTISLGYAGNGPLVTASTYFEYGRATGAKLVLWLLYDNDLRDLELELQDPALSEILSDHGEERRLLADHLLRDSLVGRMIEAVVNERIALYPTMSQWKRLRGLLTLYELRSVARRAVERVNGKSDDLASTFLRAVELVAADVRLRDAELVLVRLPSKEALESTKNRDGELSEVARAAARHLDLRYLDATPWVAGTDDWRSAFPLDGEVSAHYSEEGYRRVA